MQGEGGEVKPIHHGGLMRCCLETLRKYIEDEGGNESEGITLNCAWCHGVMVVSGGAWRWKGEKGAG